MPPVEMPSTDQKLGMYQGVTINLVTLLLEGLIHPRIWNLIMEGHHIWQILHHILLTRYIIILSILMYSLLDNEPPKLLYTSHNCDTHVMEEIMRP